MTALDLSDLSGALALACAAASFAAFAWPVAVAWLGGRS